MGKRIENVAFAGGFDGISTCDYMVACSQEPTTYTEAYTTYKLASVAIDGGDFAQADGDVSGRKLTVAAQTLTGTGDGTVNHVALVKSGSSALYVVTTCTSVGITNGNPQNFLAWKIEWADPT